jgi:hypothetical protein
MQSVKKYCCDVFLQSAHLPGLFSPCHASACFESMLCMFWTHCGYKEVCNVLLGMLCKVTSAKHAWLSLEKIWMGQMCRLEEKIAAILLYWLHSFPSACLMFFISYILKLRWCPSVCLCAQKLGSAWKILPVTARSLWIYINSDRGGASTGGGAHRGRPSTRGQHGGPRKKKQTGQGGQAKRPGKF